MEERDTSKIGDVFDEIQRLEKELGQVEKEYAASSDDLSSIELLKRRALLVVKLEVAREKLGLPKATDLTRILDPKIQGEKKPKDDLQELRKIEVELERELSTVKDKTGYDSQARAEKRRIMAELDKIKIAIEALSPHSTNIIN